MHALFDTINTHGITITFLTTALFNLIIDEDPTILSGLSQVLTGGDAHSIKHIRKAIESLPNTEIIHVYGPTECTTFATFQKVTPLLATSDAIPIGHPINQTKLYVLDDNHTPVSTGMVGELYIGGPGLAQKYLNAETLTEDKFIQNLPFLDMEQKIYKTGDLVIMRSDGALNYIARIDNQVKIHGYRIELGEIETALIAFEEINQAVVLVHTIHERKRLIAYLVPQNQPLEKSTIGSRLRTRLPNYMIPSDYIWLDKMPLTHNGKIDRKILMSKGKPEELVSPHL